MRRFDYTPLETRVWDTDIVNMIGKIHECKGRQAVWKGEKPAELTRLIEIAKIQSTEASNKIEGIVTTSARMKKLFAEKTMPRNRDEDEIMGYRDVLETIHENYEYIPIKPTYILQLHRDLLKKAKLSFAGHFKNCQNYINETLPDGTNITRFVPVEPYDTPRAVEELCEAYERARSRENIDSLLLIPIFLNDFLCIHPFNDGNGRMSRLLTLLLLYQNGYDVGKYISVEKQIEKTKDLYYTALQEAGIGWHEGNNDPVPFIRYMLQVILACYAEMEERIGTVSETGGRISAYDKVKAYAGEKIGPFTGADVAAYCPGIGRSSVLAALKKLTEEGRIEKRGVGKNTFYVRIDK